MGTYKRYKVIDKVQDPEFTQWMGSLVQKALRNSKIDADTVEIYSLTQEFRENYCIFFEADTKRFMLRILVFMEIDYDSNNEVCAEKVAYSLYEVTEIAPDGTHIYRNNPIGVSTAVITWDNAIIDAIYEQEHSQNTK